MNPSTPGIVSQAELAKTSSLWFPVKNRKRNSLRNLNHSWSDMLNEDGGVDPRFYFGSGRRASRNHRKAAQLCRQVMHTLQYVLHGDGSSELLNSLSVLSVLPAPDTSRLLVIVQTDLEPAEVSLAELMAVLASQSGRLRTEIARSINRKQTPQLTFQLAASPF